MRPRSAGTFLISLSATSANRSAWATIRSIAARSSSSIESRWFTSCLQWLRSRDRDLVHAVELPHAHVDVLVPRGRQVLADVVRADRELAMTAVREHGELHPGGPAVVEQRLDRGAHRAAGEEDVVHDHDRQ